MPARRLFTSESVTEGHPDKICDAVSDGILDALLAQDPKSRVAVETMVTTGQVHVAGEVTTNAQVNYVDVVRKTILDIGYDSSAKGFDGESCGVSISIGAQSKDIAQGVDEGYETRVEGSEDEIARQGAGDQGLMFGYADADTPELMPLPIGLAHRLARKLTAVRRDGTLPYLRPDGKTQVTIAYDDDKPVGVETVVLSTQHAADIDLAPLRNAEGLDMVIVRENVEGEYSEVGGRLYRGRPEEMAVQEAVFTRLGVTRVAEFAVEQAKARRGLVTSATKSNGIIHTMPFWDEVVAEVVERAGDVSLDKMLIDALAARVVLKPLSLDVIVASNLFGDIISDLAAAAAGSIGVAPSGNINPPRDHPSMFEPVHGSAPDIAGQGFANPRRPDVGSGDDAGAPR